MEQSATDCPTLAVQIVSDLKTLRTLAEYLLILDPVTFLGYLENLRAAESINSIWLFHDAAHTIFEQVEQPDLSLDLHGPMLLFNSAVPGEA